MVIFVVLFEEGHSLFCIAIQDWFRMNSLLDTT